LTSIAGLTDSAIPSATIRIELGPEANDPTSIEPP
jgi:hypothetical protein